jgi:hypothetical protein
MLRITAMHIEGGAPVLKLEGKLLQPWIEELQQSCRRLGEGGVRPALDLSGVSYLDPPAVVALRDLERRGVSLLGCTPLVVELLKESR